MESVQLSCHSGITNKDTSKGNMGDGWVTVNMTPDVMAKWLKSGKPISVAALKSTKRNEENFLSSQILGIDFDHGPSVQELSQTSAAKKYSTITYSTFNSTPDEPRSRMIVFLDRPIKDAAEYKSAVDYFYSQIKGVDLQCKSAAQVFFGNDAGEYVINEGKAFPVDTIVGKHIKKPQPTVFMSEASKILVAGSNNGSRHSDFQVLMATYANKLELPALETLAWGWYDKLADKTDFPWDHCKKEVENYAKKSAAVLKNVNRAVAQTIDSREELKRKPAVARSFTHIGWGDPEISWLIDGILPAKTTALLVAPPEHFKTWFAFAMAMSIGTGLPLFGRYKVPKPQKVLLMQMEDSRAIIHQRLQLMYVELSKSFVPLPDPNVGNKEKEWLCQALAPNVSVYFTEDTFKLGNQTHMDELEGIVAEGGFDLVIIDPLYAIADSSDYMAKDMGNAVRFKRWRDKYGTSFMILHHTKKSNGVTSTNGKQRREQTHGSQFINAYAETTMMLRGTKSPKETLFDLHIKSQEGRETRLLTWDISTKGDDHHFRVTEAIAPKDTNGANPLQPFLDHGPLTVGQFAEIVGISSSSASRKLMKMASAEIVRRNPDQTYSLIDVED